MTTVIPTKKFDWLKDYFYNTGNPLKENIIHTAKRYSLNTDFVLFLVEKAEQYKMDLNNISYAFINYYAKQFPPSQIHGPLKFNKKQIKILIDNKVCFNRLNICQQNCMHLIEFTKGALQYLLNNGFIFSIYQTDMFGSTIFCKKIMI